MTEDCVLNHDLMARVSYPFAALPNQVCRGGHGAINVAILAVLMSHGRTSASAKTLANEVGCDRKSVFKSLKYWQTEGPKHGIFLRSGERSGCTTIFEVAVTECREASTTDTENGTSTESVQCRKGNTAVPNTEQAPVPKTAHKEEPVRRPLKNIHPPTPLEGDGGSAYARGGYRSRAGPKKPRPFIDGDLAHYDESRGMWRVRIHSGEWVDYIGALEGKLVWK